MQHAAHGDPVSAQLQSARATAHHGPDGTGTRRGTALCLSGGGFRAALFHLGALRRLDELGILGSLRTVSAVSGGSMVAAMLTDPRLDWPTGGAGTTDSAVPGAGGRVGGFEELVAEPVRRLTSRDVRTPALIARLRHPRRPGAMVTELAAQMIRAVPQWGADLRHVRRGGPAVLIGATEVGYGVGWLFADSASVPPNGLMGDHRLGYCSPPTGLRIADAVAASCALPPFFSPMVLPGAGLGLVGGVPDPDDADEPETHAAITARIELADGGVVDSLGVERVWGDHEDVLVSDGGQVFRGRRAGSLLGQLWHLLSISSGGGQTTRLRWLRSAFAAGRLRGATWSLESPSAISSVPGHGPSSEVDQLYPASVVGLINRMRTDVDAFDRAEQKVLERHGYVVADDAVRRHAAHLLPREPRTGTDVRGRFAPPHPDLADPHWAGALLRDSRRLRPRGRRTAAWSEDRE